ncbi:MAG: hypothetical protein DRN06_02180 [Thermoprotei archaeon]|nr:MAG: hypothetical protein DRN06_02180 [Thermoprotei archaeon]
MLNLKGKILRNHDYSSTPLHKLVKQRGFKPEVKRKFHLLILYLATLSSSGASSKDLFRLIGALKSSLGVVAQVFRRIDLLVNKWGYNQVNACKLVSRALPNCELKDLLLRMSQAIGVGLPMKDFSNIEYNKYLTSYQDEYERAMDRLKRFCEAYSAMLTASAFISVAMILVSMIYGVSSAELILTLTVVMIVTIIASLLYLIYKNAPRGRVVALDSFGPRGLKRLEQWSLRLFIISGIVAASIALIYVTYFIYMPPLIIENLFLSKAFPVPVSLMGLGGLLLVLGARGKRRVEQIKQMDIFYPVFIKTLGDAASISGGINEAVKAIVYNDYGPLNNLIKRLHRRLKIGIKNNVAWEFFGQESGSLLIREGTKVFFSAVENGGKAKESALSIFDFSTLVLTLRKRRSQVLALLKGLIFPLQATLIAVMTLVKSLMNVFLTFTLMVSSYVSLIGYIGEGVMVLFLITIALTLTFGNSLALHLVEGESLISLSYYGGILLLITGAVMWLVDGAATTIFSIFTGFGEEVVGLSP